MGLFKKILGTVQSKNMSVQYSQPTGFYIVRHEYGENQARLLFQQANDGNVDAQLSIAKCFMDVAEQPYALPWYEKAAIAGNAKALHELQGENSKKMDFKSFLNGNNVEAGEIFE